MLKARSTQTAGRILVIALDSFNRLGEPNVAPAALAKALGMSSGNLYYHYPSKADLVNALFDAYLSKVKKILLAGRDVQNVEDAWFFIHTLFEHIGEYRFIYRDLSDLLSKNVQVEKQIQRLTNQKIEALERAIQGLHRHQLLELGGLTQARTLAISMALVMTYWLNFDYLQAPRTALEPGYSEIALLKGAFQVLHLLVPYLRHDAREHLEALSQAYL
jgi:AcrR family transcriptional regulator